MGASGEEPPLLFFKPSTALIGDGGTVIRPRFSLDLHHELELVVAIGRPGKRIAAHDAGSHILGYAVGLDMTLRDVQTEAKRRGHPWAVSKGFDNSAPLSEVVPAAQVPDPDELVIELLVNGERRQRGRAGDMVLSVSRTVEYVSSVFMLEEGDLIFTGTPEGVGSVFPGDRLDATLVQGSDRLAAIRIAVAGEDGDDASLKPGSESSESKDDERGSAEAVPGRLPASGTRRAG
jgi:2-keto-4-pentenoate hydratase/2-oxohepta-3-ene-1,7-dioic acid hydratase in catechol pathway